ncbi:MAG: hypothetical protein HFI65_01770 [Lachnospiraceae bacterium]|nr:hypothetical protein [Lachnospiraceae bacterium]
MLSLSLLAGALICPHVKAAEGSTPVNMAKTAEERMTELRMQDEGPDFTKGQLLEEAWGMEEDGTPYVERTYVKIPVGRAMTRFRTYTKTKSYGATGSVEVTAMFAWNTEMKKAYVLQPSGKFNAGGGIDHTENERVTMSGTGTEKASATYSIVVHRYMGVTGPATYSVTISCDYKGNCTGNLVS